MATVNFVNRKLALVIRNWNLTVNSSKEEIRQAIEEAHHTGEPNRRNYGPGIRVLATPRPIFPQEVKTPSGSEWTGDEYRPTGWRFDHVWGDGSNESIPELVRLAEELLVSQTGLDGRRWKPEDIRRNGAETLREIEQDLKTLESGRGPGSPYSQNYQHEAQVALRLGASFLVRLHKQMHWKAWRDAVNFMFYNEGYEELAPWHFIFQGYWTYDEEWKGSFRVEFPPNQDCLEAVREYGWLVSRDEMARVISILAKYPQEFTTEKVIWWATGHKSWAENSSELTGEREDWVEFLAQVFSFTEDWVELGKVLSAKEYSESILFLLAKVFFEVSPDTRGEFLRTSEAVSTESAFKIYGILEGSSYFLKNATLVKNLIDKGFDLKELVKIWPETEQQSKYFETAIAGYMSREGDRFANSEEFIKRGLVDSLGEDRSWYTSMTEIVGEVTYWQYFFRNDASMHDCLYFVPIMIEKLDSYSIKRIIEQADDARILAQCINAYESDGTRFDGWRQFIKHTNLQRYSITVPGDDPVLKKAVETMLEAPGINVSAVRSALQEQRFQALARGEMDGEQLFKPVVRRFYLTPTTELVRLALGVKGSAEQSAELEQKLVRLAKRYHKAQMQEYQRAKAEGQKVMVPQELDFAIYVPEELAQDVSDMLTEHGVELKMFKNLPVAVRFAIGVRPAAQQYKQLFAKLQRLAKEIGLKGALDLLKAVPQNIEQMVWALLEEHEVPMGPCLKAEILAKSDPRGWVCGDWTVCCMSFGSSNNWDYMYHRTKGYFVVSIDKGNGDERLIAQSVIVAAVREGRAVDPESMTMADIDAVVLDNIEFSSNFAQYQQGIEEVYSRFWSNASRKRVMVGKSHNDLTPAGAVSSMEGQWKPVESYSYSDFSWGSPNYWLIGGK